MAGLLKKSQWEGEREQKKKNPEFREYTVHVARTIFSIPRDVLKYFLKPATWLQWIGALKCSENGS